jgi:hypothetical protein
LKSIWRPKSGPKLGDGCYHIFIDLGANIGVNARFLFQPHLYPDAQFIHEEIFGPVFGSAVQRDNRDFCVFSWEPNPNHRKRWENLTESYQRMNWRITYFNAGVGDHDGSIHFYHLNDEAFQEFGFTFSPPPRNRKFTMESVPLIRISDWLWNEIWQRELPTSVYGNYSEKGPKVVMKMDIELMEYVVLPDLLLSGALCNNVHLLFGEFHFIKDRFPFNTPYVSLRNRKDARVFFQNLMSIHSVSHNCLTNMIWQDSEAYLHDGMPLP